MKNVIIDCEKLLHRKEVHLYLAQMLDFPDYYGKNLDALFDCLTDMEECIVVLKDESALYQTDNYGTKVLKVLEEAAQANPKLKLEIQETET